MDNKVFQEFLNRNPNIVSQLDPNCEFNSIEVGDYIYVTCNLLTFGSLDYTIIYEPQNDNPQSNQLYRAAIESKDEVFRYGSDYWTPYNRGYFAKRTDEKCFIIYCEEHEADIKHVGKGAGLIILDKRNLTLKNVYYFRDTYNMDFSSEIIAQVGRKLLVRYAEYNYVFFEGAFTGLGFVASEHKIFGNLLINFWYYGYDAFCPWQLIDLGKMNCNDIYALDIKEHPEFRQINDCVYDYETSEFVFTFQDGNKIALGIQELRANKDQANKLRYSNLGTPYGYCRLLP